MLHESGQGDSYLTWVGGFEYTWFGFNESDLDLGFLVEHLFDGRGRHAPHPLENDIFAGARLGFNDEASTEILAGVVADADGDSTALNVEASRRIGESWKVEVEARAWNGVDHDDPMVPLRRDDYIQFTLSRFFRVSSRHRARRRRRPRAGPGGGRRHFASGFAGRPAAPFAGPP